jgi:hypothetical protein
MEQAGGIGNDGVRGRVGEGEHLNGNGQLSSVSTGMGADELLIVGAGGGVGGEVQRLSQGAVYQDGAGTAQGG